MTGSEIGSVIPDRPWLRLEEVEAILLKTGAVPVEEIQMEGESYLSGDTVIELSRWLSEAAFSGRVRLMGRPAKPHEGVAHGPMQEIPVFYFRKSRSFYGSAGIGRLAFQPSLDELKQDAIDMQRGTSEDDWLEVLVGRDGLEGYLVGMNAPSRSGAPGRPTSMHLVDMEFRRRVEGGRAEASNTVEAEHLALWLKSTFPKEPQLTPKTIRNHLAPLRRKLFAARN